MVEAVSGLLLGRHAGQFNLSPDGLMTLRECAELLDTPIRKMPLWAYRALAKLLWRLRLSEAPPGQIDFALYPWIVSNEKIKATLGWTPKHTSRETFEITMRAQGKLPPAEPPPRPRRPTDARAILGLLSRAVSSAGRAPARQAGGHWFEPSTAHQDSRPVPTRTGPYFECKRRRACRCVPVLRQPELPRLRVLAFGIS